MLFAEGITFDPAWIVTTVGGLCAAVASMFWLLIGSKDKQLADKDTVIDDLKSKVKSNEAIAQEALTSALDTANYYRTTYEKKPPIIPRPAVVPEANSPSTKKQRDEADIATKRALLAEIKRQMHQEPRATPPEAIEKGEGVHNPVADFKREIKEDVHAQLTETVQANQEHTKKLDEKVDDVAADVKVVREATENIQAVVDGDKAAPKGRTG